MLNPRPATIPGLFQFPPALESRPAPYDDHRAPPNFASSSRIPVGMIPGVMRHNQPTPYQQPQLESTYANSAPHLQTPHARVPQIDGAFATPARHPQTLDAPSFAPSPSPSYPEHAQQYVQHSIYARVHPVSSTPHPVPHPTHQSRPEHQWGPPHAHAQHIIPSAGERGVSVAVKEEEEESPEDSAMWVSEDTPCDSDTQQLREYYYPRYTEEPEMVQSPVDAPMHECKQEEMEHDFVEQPYPVQYADEGATQNWANAAGFYPPQPPDCYSPAPPSQSSTGLAAAYPHPYSPGMYVDAPMSPDASYPVAMPDAYPLASLHTMRPLPAGPTRSYTLEGAITPLSPKPRPAVHSASTLPAKRKSSSPPPMGSLLPPTPQPHIQTETQTSETPAPASSPQHQVAASGSASPPSSAPANPAAHKKARGRPRRIAAPISADSADSHVIPPPPSVPVPVPVVNPAPASASAPNDSPASGQAMFKLDMAVATAASVDTGKEAEKKKPIMACLFCRERKIACGPPPPGGPQRCNQCTRRGLPCEYPKESRRGQHKRGARAAKVEAHAAASGASSPSSSSDKPSGKGKSRPRVDTKNLPQLQAASSSQMQMQSAVDVLMRSSSPLTPIPSPSVGARSLPNSPAGVPAPGRRNPTSLPSPANGLASPTDPATAVGRKSRPEKVELMREGKERSRSRQREQPLGDTQLTAARRAAVRQMQAQKRRASASSAGGEHEYGEGIVRLPVTGVQGAYAVHPHAHASASELSGMQHARGMRG